MKRQLTTILLTALAALALLADSPGRLNVGHIDSRDGLAANYVTEFDFDPAGRIWIGTSEGLNVYDGIDMLGAEMVAPALLRTEITHVYADKKRGEIWVATSHKGVFRIDSRDGRILEEFNTGNGRLPEGSVKKIRGDSDGTVWILQHSRLLRYRDGKMTAFTPQNLKGLPANIVNISEGPGTTLMIASDEGLALLDKKTNRLRMVTTHSAQPTLPSDNVSEAVYDHVTGLVYIGTDHGIVRINPGTGASATYSTASGLPVCYIESMMIGSDGYLWVSLSNMGLWRMKIDTSSAPAPDSFAHISSVSSGIDIDNLFVSRIAEDNFGNLWFASHNAGLCYCCKLDNPFHWLKAPYALSNTHVKALGWCSDRLIAGGFNGYIDLTSPSATETTKERIYIRDNNIPCMLVDEPRQTAWVTSANGIHILHDGRKEETLPYTRITAMAQCGRKIYLLHSNRIVSLDADTRRILSDTVYATQTLEPTCAVADLQGRLWIATAGHGIMIFNQAGGTTTALDDESGLIGPRVNQLQLMPDGNIAAATGNGLRIINTKDNKVSVPEGEESLGDIKGKAAKSLVADGFGNIWFSTINALGCYNTANRTMRRYDSAFLNMDGNFVAGAASHSDGNIAFGTTDGIICFKGWHFLGATDDQGVKFHLIALRVHPSGANNPEIYLPVGDGKMNLDHDQSTVTITFATDNYALNDKVVFAYRLKGLSDQWVEAGDANRVTFQGLSPGNYTFELRARDTQGKWSEKPEQLEIGIRPPFYASVWAESLYVILAVMLIVWITMLYKRVLMTNNERVLREADIKRMTAFNEDRLRFYTSITHELKTPLTLILAPAEDLKNDHSLSMEAKDKINLISVNATRLLDLVNKLLTFRQCETNHIKFSPMYGDLSRTVAGVVDMFRETNCNPLIKIGGDVQPDVLCVYDAEVVTLILNNLMSNALKYTKEGYVNVGMHVAGGRIVMTVTDSGVGIPADEVKAVFDRYFQSSSRPDVEGIGIGLSIVKTLVDLHGGTVEAGAGTGGVGTEFKVTLPYVQAEAAPGTETEAEIAEIPQPDDASHRKIIVIADDNKEIATYIEHLLNADFEVHVASNGKEALDLVRHYMPDIIISDVLMPTMSGLDLCDVIKHDESLCHIPVILLTAKSAREDITEGYKTGADSYITKPFSSALLRTRVDNLLESRRQLASTLRKAVMDVTSLTDKTDETPVSDTSALLPMNGLNALDRQFLEKVRSLIEDNISSSDFNANWLADHMNMSASTLYRKLRSVIGISAIELIKRVRMKMAARLLLSGQYNISETAWKVGINNMKYFRECFRETYGMNPTDYIASKGGKIKDNTEGNEA